MTKHKLSYIIYNVRYELSNYINSYFSINAGWSSLEARRAHNPKVVGSNPAPAIAKPSFHIGEIGMMVLFDYKKTKKGILWKDGLPIKKNI